MSKSFIFINFIYLRTKDFLKLFQGLNSHLINNQIYSFLLLLGHPENKVKGCWDGSTFILEYKVKFGISWNSFTIILCHLMPHFGQKRYNYTYNKGFKKTRVLGFK